MVTLSVLLHGWTGVAHVRDIPRYHLQLRQVIPTIAASNNRSFQQSSSLPTIAASNNRSVQQSSSLPTIEFAANNCSFQQSQLPTIQFAANNRSCQQSQLPTIFQPNVFANVCELSNNLLIGIQFVPRISIPFHFGLHLMFFSSSSGSLATSWWTTRSPFLTLLNVIGLKLSCVTCLWHDCSLTVSNKRSSTFKLDVCKVVPLVFIVWRYLCYHFAL